MLYPWILAIWLGCQIGLNHLPLSLSAPAVLARIPAEIIANVQPISSTQPELNPETQSHLELVEVYSNHCLTHIEQGNYDFAIAACDAAIELDPQTSEHYLTRGVAFYRRGKYQAALDDFEWVLAGNARDYRGFYNHGLVNLALHRFPEALTDFNQALKLAPPTAVVAEIYDDRGLAQLMAAAPKAAIADFTRALQANSDDARALFNRGCACHQVGQLDAAMGDFNQLLRLHPTDVYTYLRRGLVRHDLGDRSGAIQDLSWAANYARQQQNPDLQHQILTLINDLQMVSSAVG